MPYFDSPVATFIDISKHQDMTYYIKTQGELITVVYYAPTEGAIEVEADKDLVECGDTLNKYRYINGEIVLNPNYL